MWKNSTFVFCFFLICRLTSAQFANGWIEPAQSYYKFKIAETGFYRITGAEFTNAGFPINTVPASRIQLFRQGQELALNVVSNPDGTLDYLEFFGERLDGSADTELYDDGEQPHTYYNLFSDSSSYFLTYKLGSGAGKRMVFSSDKNASGLTPEAYHLADTLQLFNAVYAPGFSFGSNGFFSFSKYDDGEGWTGTFQRKNNFRDFSFSLENYTGDTDPTLESVLIGGNTRNHNINFSVGQNTGALSSLGNITFSGYTHQSYEETFDGALIGAGGELTVRVLVEGFPDVADRASVAYLRVVYPQAIEMKAGENKIFQMDDLSARRAWLQIGTTNASGTRVFDITDPYNVVRMATTSFSDRLEVVVPDVSAGNRLMAVTNFKSVPKIESVTLPDYNLSNKDYLIITHSLLRSGGAINDYKQYRESDAGGNHSVQIANVEDLYNLFGYGNPTPLAIQKFIAYANSQHPVENVFIIGKGFLPYLSISQNAQLSVPRIDSSFVNVPTYGNPGSDLTYVFGFGGNDELPGIPIGRLNATKPSQVTAYLNKVIEMEAMPYNDLFRKDFLQLSGGISEAEINSFANIVQGFTSRLEQDYIGGRAFNTGKETSESVEFIDVSDRVNQGVGYVTFFGHSSGTVTDIEIGRVSDPQFGFSNKGKYPVFLVNGCRAGEIFGSNFTFGEDWTLTPNLGAVSFMAHTSSAVASTLRNWSNLYYEIGFGDEYIGSTVGEVIVEVSRQYFDTYGSSDLNLTQVQQMLLQGDPAYKLFGATAPDYQVTNESVYAESIEVGEILATQDSFKVNIITKNFGRTVDDPLIVEIARIYPNGSQTSYLKEFERVLRNDTLVFYIPLEPTSVNEGSNILTIKLDPQNMVAELDESNNLATLEVSILSGNTIHLFPIDNGIEATDEIEFVWQSSNLLEEERTYELEFDTRADFNGPNSRSVEVSGAVLMRHSFDFSTFSLPDSTVVYWRTRYAEPSQGESNEWVESSFTIVSNAAYGWAQYEPDQIAELLVSGVNYNDDTKEWAFIQTTNPIEIFTFGADNTDLDSADFRAIINGINFAVTSNTIDPLCFDNTFNAIAFDRESGDPYRPIETEEIDVFNDEVCGRLPQRIYQFEEEDMIGASRRFEVLVDNMRDGDMIVMFNIGYVAYSNWDAEVIGTLNSLGVNTATIQSLTDGQPVIFFGRNGDAPGSASEVVSNGSAEPIGEQIITLEDEAFGSFTSGQIRSPRVGPAKDWESFSFRFSEEVNDQYNLEVYGISPDGSSSSLVQRGRVETIDVSAVDPVLYPELELVLDFDDETDQTPLQFDYWQVGYSKPPEGLITITSKEIKEVQEGEEVSKAYGFVNISTIDFTDSLTVMARMINQETGRVEAQSFRIGPPLAGDTTTFEVTFSTFDMPGANSLVVEVMPNENEAYSINNRLTFANAVDVNPDETNPVLDVTFDGFHILNGDVVSPDPLISIVMRDDNPFISKSDTVGINLSLKLPGETSQFERVNFSDPRLVFTPASESQDFEIAYSPGPLEDGIYALRIQAEDESGNQAGADPYEISFEVINASTITHFYPYPNPFSTSCRFVFTLTGSEIPDEIKIQIMTVSGRVVREITQDEIGPVRIGNNITSYAWDGRDEFGDELANGVYFYKVFTNTNGNALERRATAGDRAFKHGFGKLYILR